MQAPSLRLLVLSSCLVTSLWSVAVETAETVRAEVGETNEYSLEDGQIDFVFLFNRTAEGQSPALRLVVASENVTLRHPLLLTARQSQGVSSWAIPYVESGFSFSVVERTLCPLLNNNPDEPDRELRVVLEVSTTSVEAINFTISSSFVENFYHSLNVPASVTASPSAPTYLLFEHRPETSRVRVRFSSKDNTSAVCAIASIQKSYCPVVELLDNPDHRGTYQTMRSQAAINIELVSIDEDTEVITDRQQTQFSFFYIVVSVFPSNDTCQSVGVTATSRLITLDVADNFNPVSFTGPGLTKHVNVTVETLFPASGYAVGIIVPIVIYFMFYLIALGWILFADWIKHMNHPLERLIEERKQRLSDYCPLPEAEADITMTMTAESAQGEPDPESGLTAAATAYARQTSKLTPELSIVSEASHPDLNTPAASYEGTGKASSHTHTDPTHPVGPSPAHNAAKAHTHQAKTNSDPTHEPSESPAHKTADQHANSSPTHLIASSPTHLPSPGSTKEEIDRGYSFKKSLRYFKRSQKDKIDDSVHFGGQALKKPGAMSVLFGSQYNTVINEVTTPSPHYPQYLHSSTATSPHHSTNPPSRHTSSGSGSQHPAHMSHARHASSRSSSQQNHAHMSHAHHHSGGSVASPSTRHVTRSISLGSPYKSVNASSTHPPRLQPSISLTSPVVHQVSLHGRRRMFTDGMLTSSRDYPDAVEERVELEMRSRPRTLSYTQAMEMGLKGAEFDQEGAGAEGGDVGMFDSPMGEEEEEECKYCHDKLPFPVNLNMCELPEFDETAHVQKHYNLLSWYLIAVIIFYAIPAYQLVLTAQQLLTLSGNQDLCYYNTLCSHPWRISNRLTLSAFNNLCSNVGYFILGFLFMLIAYRRRRVYRALEEVVNNPFITHKDERVGVPQHFGIYYAIGLALIAEGFMSVAYHICPGKANYQFDTTFMFVLAGLGIFKLLEGRNPDKHPGFHKLLVLVAAMIVMVVVGVLASSLAFYIVFFFVHILCTFVVTVEYYYRWELKWGCLGMYLRYVMSKPYCPPKQMPKFVMCVLANVLNWGFALYSVVFQPADFGTFFLTILLTNFILLLIYYVLAKFVYKERPSFRPLFFLILALLSWGVGIYFYTQAVTDWLEPPAVSRDGNSECVALFYDSHDMWHFASAFALFFSFLMLMTLDDDTEGTLRTRLRVF